MIEEDLQIIEIILFIENRPLSVDELKKMAHMKEEVVLDCLKELKKKFDNGNHGIELESCEEGYQFSPRLDLYDRLRKTAYGKKVDSRLTHAALETLSIIAYSQPVTRRQIDDTRGVSSENIVKILRDRGYIKVYDRTNEWGHPCRYATTIKFLEEFNMKSIDELPHMDVEESERFEVKDEDGTVLTSRLIKKRRKEEESVDSGNPSPGGGAETVQSDSPVQTAPTINVQEGKTAEFAPDAEEEGQSDETEPKPVASRLVKRGAAVMDESETEEPVSLFDED